MPNRSVLLVDDDRLVRETLAEALEDFPCAVELADGGLAGWQCFQQQTHDIVISDVDMPDISGFELLARIKRTSSRVPVVLMSARAPQLQQQAVAAGAHTLLDKPIALDPFAALVGDLLHQSPP